MLSFLSAQVLDLESVPCCPYDWAGLNDQIPSELLLHNEAIGQKSEQERNLQPATLSLFEEMYPHPFLHVLLHESPKLVCELDQWLSTPRRLHIRYGVSPKLKDFFL